MDDNHKRIKERERGHQATLVLDNPIYQEAWASVEHQLKAGWENSSAAQSEERERIWQALQMLRKVRSYLDGVIKTGELATIQLNEVEPYE